MTDRASTPWVTYREVAALALATLALGGSLVALERARRKADPRRAVAQAIRREASPKDLALVLDESPELVAIMRPVPALWGAASLADLAGVRRLYVLAPTEVALAPVFARMGPAAPFHGEARARRWDVADGHLGRVVFDINESLLTAVRARREGGADEGPCPVEENRLVCRGPGWNPVLSEVHHFDGAEVRCVYAHPQADGRLVLEVSSIPAARALVGIVGVDDAGFFPTGADVTARLVYRPEGQPEVTRDLVAHNRRGVTPWRVEVPAKPATATITITTPNAGARQFCFTLSATL